MSSSLSSLSSAADPETIRNRSSCANYGRSTWADPPVSGRPWPEEGDTTKLCHTACAQTPVDQRRRHAAVLFADLSGFTALVDRLEPEDVYACVRPLLDELVMLVEIRGGEIQQVLGDGFMAVFGLRSDSHDAWRTAGEAVTSGVALLGAGRDLSGRLPVHVGVECGEVLISRAWRPARYAVWGRPVTVAARLCDLAGPHTVNIGPQAFELNAGVVASLNTRPKGFRREILVQSVTVPRPTSRSPVSA
jgi:class 3 adenylate cyclase